MIYIGPSLSSVLANDVSTAAVLLSAAVSNKEGSILVLKLLVNSDTL